MRKKDAVLLALFSGTLLITTLVTIVALIIPPSNQESERLIDWEELLLTAPAFRFVFMMILTLLFVALDVYILRKFRVNYIFIFGLDPNYKVTHI
jgi:EXS family